MKRKTVRRKYKSAFSFEKQRVVKCVSIPLMEAAYVENEAARLRMTISGFVSMLIRIRMNDEVDIED